MIIRCAELIKEEKGNISVGECYIGDSPEAVVGKLGNYSKVDINNKGIISCWLDIDLMWPRNVIADKDVFDSSILCSYDPKLDNGIRKIELVVNCYDHYPFHTVAEFEEKIDYMARSPYYEYTTPIISPKSNLDCISIESSICEYELIWHKKGYKGNYSINAIVTPNSKLLYGSPYEKEILYLKTLRKLALELGKLPKELTESEKKDAMHRAGLTE